MPLATPEYLREAAEQISVSAMRDALRDAADEIDGDYGIPAPNRAMILLGEVRAAIQTLVPNEPV